MINKLLNILSRKTKIETNESPGDENKNTSSDGSIQTTNKIKIILVNEQDEEKSEYLKPNNSHQNESPYSIFSTRKKTFIVILIAITSFISTVSANIYFPILKTISEELQTSIDLINLTVTAYMISQGISPSFWGNISDHLGRRPVYIVTLTIYILSCAGISISTDYITLLILRAFQAFGSSSTIAIGAGVVGDISTPSERGGYMGIYSLGIALGPIVGPVAGGIISSNIGWRWIFTILCIFSGCILTVLIFALPETLRSLVGNGSIYANPTPQQFIHHHLQKRKKMKNEKDQTIYSIEKEITTESDDIYSTSSILKNDQQKKRKNIDIVFYLIHLLH
ncbi:unnamed protein product [Cunninghamella blakesleeana]